MMSVPASLSASKEKYYQAKEREREIIKKIRDKTK